MLCRLPIRVIVNYLTTIICYPRGYIIKLPKGYVCLPKRYVWYLGGNVALLKGYVNLPDDFVDLLIGYVSYFKIIIYYPKRFTSYSRTTFISYARGYVSHLGPT
jgi:hypothetical protein